MQSEVCCACVCFFLSGRGWGLCVLVLVYISKISCFFLCALALSEDEVNDTWNSHIGVNLGRFTYSSAAGAVPQFPRVLYVAEVRNVYNKYWYLVAVRTLGKRAATNIVGAALQQRVQTVNILCILGYILYIYVLRIPTLVTEINCSVLVLVHHEIIDSVVVLFMARVTFR